jgi:hypothetical protein
VMGLAACEVGWQSCMKCTWPSNEGNSISVSCATCKQYIVGWLIHGLNGSHFYQLSVGAPLETLSGAQSKPKKALLGVEIENFITESQRSQQSYLFIIRRLFLFVKLCQRPVHIDKSTQVLL